MNAASATSLGVKVHISDTFSPTPLPESLRQDKRVIVVAFDESSESQYSLSWTLANIFSPESDILILLSVAIFHEPYFLVKSIVGSEPEKKQLFAEDFSSRLSSVSSSIIEDQNLKNIKAYHEIYIPSSGDVRSVIVDYCHSSKADILVMGNRGLGMVQRLSVRVLCSLCTLSDIDCPKEIQIKFGFLIELKYPLSVIWSIVLLLMALISALLMSFY